MSDTDRHTLNRVAVWTEIANAFLAELEYEVPRSRLARRLLTRTGLCHAALLLGGDLNQEYEQMRRYGPIDLMWGFWFPPRTCEGDLARATVAANVARDILQEHFPGSI